MKNTRIFQILIVSLFALVSLTSYAGSKQSSGAITQVEVDTFIKQINKAFESKNIDKVMSFVNEDATIIADIDPAPQKGSQKFTKAQLSAMLKMTFPMIDSVTVRYRILDFNYNAEKAVAETTVEYVTEASAMGQKSIEKTMSKYHLARKGDSLTIKYQKDEILSSQMAN